MSGRDDLDALTTLDMLRTKLAVRDVGSMAARGATREELLAKYPDLREQDIELAQRIVGDPSGRLLEVAEVDAIRFRRHPSRERTKVSEFDRWVNDHNTPETFDYGKGWWDYIELVRRFAVRLDSKDVRVIGHYIVDTPPPCERLPMPAVAISTPGVTFALRFDFGSWSLYESVADCIDFESLCDIERRLAFALGRIEGTTDEQMLAWPRVLIASALRVLAERYANGQPDDVEDLEVRYSNAICRASTP